MKTMFLFKFILMLERQTNKQTKVTSQDMSDKPTALVAVIITTTTTKWQKHVKSFALKKENVAQVSSSTL